jgi:hypothetical protein
MANWPSATTAGARERRNVHQRNGIVALGIGKGIGEDQPAFRIRVLHFHRFPRQRLHDVARLHRTSSRHIFRHRQDAHQTQG